MLVRWFALIISILGWLYFYHKWEFSILRYNKRMAIYPYPFLVVLPNCSLG